MFLNALKLAMDIFGQTFFDKSVSIKVGLSSSNIDILLIETVFNTVTNCITLLSNQCQMLQ